MAESKSFQDQVIVVAGAASGIGMETARLISSLGGSVIGIDRSESGLGNLQNQVSSPNLNTRIVDIADEAKLKTVITEIASRFGGIHGLVNTAGIVGPTNIMAEQLSTAQIEETLRINLFGAIWMTQAVLPIMKRAKYGRIVHVSSIAGKEGNPGMTPYNVSKAALIGFVKGVAKEAATEGVTINAVAPAVIQTPMNADTGDETLKYMVSRIPMGRLGQATEVAQLLAFIVSRECSFTTGFTFDASGGRATY